MGSATNVDKVLSDSSPPIQRQLIPCLSPDASKASLTGDEFALPPVILLKPGEKFPETSGIPQRVSPCLIFDPDQIAKDWLPRDTPTSGDKLESDIEKTMTELTSRSPRKAKVQKLERKEYDFELPVVVLKPGEKYGVSTPSAEANGRHIFDFYWKRGVASGDVKTKKSENVYDCAEVNDADNSGEEPSTSCGLRENLTGLSTDVRGNTAEREGDGQKTSSCAESGEEQLPRELSHGDAFDLPPVILLRPGEKFPETSVVPAHASPRLFDPDEIASEWQPREATVEDNRNENDSECYMEPKPLPLSTASTTLLQCEKLVPVRAEVKC